MRYRTFFAKCAKNAAVREEENDVRAMQETVVGVTVSVAFLTELIFPS